MHEEGQRAIQLETAVRETAMQVDGGEEHRHLQNANRDYRYPERISSSLSEPVSFEGVKDDRSFQNRARQGL